jgi:hypothetical protein
VRLKIKQFMAVAGLAVMEAVRQPLCLLLLLTVVLFTGLLPFLITYSFGESGKLVRESGLALHMVSGLLMGAFLAGTAFEQYGKQDAAASILSKPIGRSLFFLARFTGIALAMLAYSAAVGIAVMLASRAAAAEYSTDWQAAGPLLSAPFCALLYAGINNYFTRRPFVSFAWGLTLFALLAAAVIAACFPAEGMAGGLANTIPWNILPAIALSTLSILLITAIASAVATRAATLATLGLCLMIFLTGLISDYLYVRLGTDAFAGRAVHFLLPNWQHFWAAEVLTEGGSIPWAYVRSVFYYTGLYLAGVLCLGTFLFRGVEIKA